MACGVVQAVRPRPGEHVAQDMVGFDWPTAFEVAQHRGRIRGTRIGEDATVLGHERLGRRVTGPRGDLGIGLEEPAQQLRPAVGANDLPDIRAHQAGHAGRRGQVDDLLPHRLHHVRTGRGQHRRAIERRLERGDPVAQAAVLFAEGDEPPVVEVLDHAVGRQRHRDLGQAAQHALTPEGAVQRFDVGQAVEQGQDRRLRSHRRPDGLDSGGKVVGLAGQDQHIDRTVDLVGGQRVDRA